MGSKSKTGTMKSYRILKNEAEQKLKNKKKENAPDIISKSVFNARAMVVREIYKSLNILNHEYTQKQSPIDWQRGERTRNDRFGER